MTNLRCLDKNAILKCIQRDFASQRRIKNPSLGRNKQLSSAGNIVTPAGAVANSRILFTARYCNDWCSHCLSKPLATSIVVESHHVGLDNVGGCVRKGSGGPTACFGTHDIARIVSGVCIQNLGAFLRKEKGRKLGCAGREQRQQIHQTASWERQIPCVTAASAARELPCWQPRLWPISCVWALPSKQRGSVVEKPADSRGEDGVFLQNTRTYGRTERGYE